LYGPHWRITSGPPGRDAPDAGRRKKRVTVEQMAFCRRRWAADRPIVARARGVVPPRPPGRGKGGARRRARSLAGPGGAFAVDVYRTGWAAPGEKERDQPWLRPRACYPGSAACRRVVVGGVVQGARRGGRHQVPVGACDLQDRGAATPAVRDPGQDTPDLFGRAGRARGGRFRDRARSQCGHVRPKLTRYGSGSRGTGGLRAGLLQDLAPRPGGLVGVT